MLGKTGLTTGREWTRELDAQCKTLFCKHLWHTLSQTNYYVFKAEEILWFAHIKIFFSDNCVGKHHAS